MLLCKSQRNRSLQILLAHNPDYFGLLLHCTLHIRTYQFNGYVRPKIPNTVTSSSVIASTKVTSAAMS
jgi:hypothetical protein